MVCFRASGFDPFKFLVDYTVLKWKSDHGISDFGWSIVELGYSSLLCCVCTSGGSPQNCGVGVLQGTAFITGQSWWRGAVSYSVWIVDFSNMLLKCSARSYFASYFYFEALCRPSGFSVVFFFLPLALEWTVGIMKFYLNFNMYTSWKKA